MEINYCLWWYFSKMSWASSEKRPRSSELKGDEPTLESIEPDKMVINLLFRRHSAVYFNYYRARNCDPAGNTVAFATEFLPFVTKTFREVANLRLVLTFTITK